MSNWRINFGIGPLRYTRALSPTRKPSQPRPRRTGVGVVITLVVTLAVVWLTCTGCAAWYNQQP